MKKRHWSVILGAPRSGTTFLLEVLAGVDNTAAVSGRGFPSHVGPIWTAELSEAVREALRTSLLFTLEDYLQDAEHSRAIAVSDALKRQIGVKELWDGLYGGRSFDGLVYKEPFLAFAPELPYQALPNSRIVHIYRDGRDAADSQVRKYRSLTDDGLRDGLEAEVTFSRPWDGRHIPWWVEPAMESEFINASPFLRALWLWRSMVRGAHEFAVRDDVAQSGRVIEVCYETLMAGPMEEGHRILDHFGLKPNSRVKRKLAAAHDRSVGVHKRRPVEEIEKANQLARDELRMLGYPVIDRDQMSVSAT